MPTFEFTCPACGEEFDRWCKISERKSQQCASCGSIGVQQVRTPVKPHWTSLAMGDSASPEAIDHFDRMHRQKVEKEEKAIKEHGSIN